MSKELIDSIIQKSGDQEVSAKGGNKKCYLIDEYALLEGTVKEEEIKKVIEIQYNLANKGVNLARTIDYKLLGGDEDKKYKKAYILQDRAKGEPLHQEFRRSNYLKLREEEKKEKQDTYLNKINSLSEEDSIFYDKFVGDWQEILKQGLIIDPSKTTNFFYEKGKKISFIDLDLNTAEVIPNMETMLMEMSVVLANSAEYITYKNEGVGNIEQINSKLSTIFGKIIDAFERIGLDRNTANKILMERFPDISIDLETIDMKRIKEDIGAAGVTLSEIRTSQETIKEVNQHKANEQGNNTQADDYEGR